MLYAFEKTAAKPGVEFGELIENIDIGGPSMIRSAAKNFQDVAVVTSAEDYSPIADELERSNVELSLATRWRLAQKAGSYGFEGLHCQHSLLRLDDKDPGRAGLEICTFAGPPGLVSQADSALGGRATWFPQCSSRHSSA